MTGDSARDRLIVALDCDGDDALSLARALDGTVRWLKIGMTLFYQQGPGIVLDLRTMGYDIFLDLKLHDIPHQVAGAAETISRLGVRMMTIHGSGGPAMLRAAIEGAGRGAKDAGCSRPAVLAVTVLTSMNDDMLLSVGVERPAREQVSLLARQAHSAGVDGIVCSPLEARDVRGILGSDALLVTPGVRPEWSARGDQQRIMTPHDALVAGASHLVVGRPITAAASPVLAAARIIAEMEESTS